jgi:mono/diheme cytochrome c family protein
MDKQFAKSPRERKMERITSSCLGALVVLCIALGVAGKGWAQDSEHQPEMSQHQPEMIAGKVTTGALEYRRHCAACHGPDGKGDGPVGKEMTTKPSDLTQITKGHGGKFPEDWVHRYIDGSDMIPSHGTSEMPIWGVEFSRTTLGSSSRMKHEIDTRIRLLVNYIKSIQEK